PQSRQKPLASQLTGSATFIRLQNIAIFPGVCFRICGEGISTYQIGIAEPSCSCRFLGQKRYPDNYYGEYALIFKSVFIFAPNLSIPLSPEMPRDRSIRSVLIIGSGPIIIGQACEFDYSGSQA